MSVPVEAAVATFQGYPPSDAERVRARLLALRDVEVDVKPYRVDVAAFRSYVERARYPEEYRQNFGGLFVEKALEHFISMDLLGFGRKDRFIDIASCSSPFPEIVESFYAIPNYRQDLSFPEGVVGKQVGGSAEKLPFPDGSFSKMTLHCSLEHFEGDADRNFIEEAARALKPGGAVCVIPLYVTEIFHNLTDPGEDRSGLFFDDGAAVAEVRGWRNRFGRNYDPERLAERVLRPASKHFESTIHVIENEKDADAVCYVKFALVLRRKRPGLLGRLGFS